MSLCFSSERGGSLRVTIQMILWRGDRVVCSKADIPTPFFFRKKNPFDFGFIMLGMIPHAPFPSELRNEYLIPAPLLLSVISALAQVQ